MNVTQFVLYTGVAVFGLFCLLKPRYFLERRKQKNGKDYDAKDIRFYRVFGAILVGLYLLGYVIQLVINLKG